MKNKFSRRDFLKISAVGLVTTGAVVIAGRMIAEPPDMKLPNPYPELPDRAPTIPQKYSDVSFFNEQQYALVATIAAILVPTDQDPGATEANVAGYIDKLVSKSEKRQKHYGEGLKWIDEVSDRKYGKDFLKLNIKEQIALLRFIDNASAMRQRKVSGVMERVDRKIDTIWDDLFGAGESIAFMKVLLTDVFYGYYSNPISWKVIGFYGPPQPVGYPNYTDPPSAINYTGNIRAVDDRTCRNCHFTQTTKAAHKNQSSCTRCHPSHFDAQ